MVIIKPPKIINIIKPIELKGLSIKNEDIIKITNKKVRKFAINEIIEVICFNIISISPHIHIIKYESNISKIIFFIFLIKNF